MKEIFKTKKAKVVAIIFVAIFCLGAFLRLHKLGMQSFIADEYLGIKIAAGYQKTGEWKHWDFNTNKLTEDEYTRGQVYYWQVAKTFDFLPISEATSRLVSVMWGLIAMLTVFCAAFIITRNWTIALIALFLSAVSITELIYDRKLRMYSMFAPVYLWFSFAVFKFLEYKKSSLCDLNPFAKKHKGQKKGRICLLESVSKKTKLSWSWLLLVIPLGFLSLKTHDLTVNILPTILVYLLIMGLYLWYKQDKESKRYLGIVAAFTFFGIVFKLAVPFLKEVSGIGYIAKKITSTSGWAGSVFHWTYLEKITLDYSYVLFGLIFILIGSYLMIKKYGKLGLWTVLSFGVPLILAIFTWKRNVGDQYIYLTQLFKVIIVACGIYFSVKKLSTAFGNSKKAFVAILLTVLLTIINVPFFYSEIGFYQSVKQWKHSNYREAYEYFLKKRDDNSALIARPLSNYYLKGENIDLLGYSKDNKMTVDRILNAQEEYDEIWAIFAQNLNITGNARRYMEKSFELKETKYTNKKVKIYVWRKSQKEAPIIRKEEEKNEFSE